MAKMKILDWNAITAPLSGGVAGLTGDDRKIALTIGVFDGIHRGHRLLIEKIVSKSPELLPAVITFAKNPKKRREITGQSEKFSLFESLGVGLCAVIDFSPDFSKLKGREFFALLCRFFNPAYAVVGVNFHCGYQKDTDAAAFKALGAQNGVEVEIAPPVMEGAQPVSSSRIREALHAGDRALAESLLGRPITQVSRSDNTWL